MEQDAPHLAAADLDAHLSGGVGQGVQGPIGGLRLVDDLRWQPIVADQPSGRILGDQGDDPGALVLRDARAAPGPGTICESIHAQGVETVEALPHGLRMTAELLGYPGRAQPSPTQGDDAGAEDPVPGGVTATGELVDLLFFLGVFGLTSVKKLRHGLLLPRSAVRSQAYVYRL